MILSGGFDPLHVGHIRLIQAARAQAALVVVGVNSDAWVTKRRGSVGMPCVDRCELLAAVRGVTSAVRFNDTDGTANDLIRRVRAMTGPESTIAFGNGGPRQEVDVPEVALCEELNIERVWRLGGAEDLEPSRPLDHF